MFGESFSDKLVKWLEGSVRKALESTGGETKLFTEKCIVCVEGPQFSTRAESLMCRQWGGDLINMRMKLDGDNAVTSPSRRSWDATRGAGMHTALCHQLKHVVTVQI